MKNQNTKTYDYIILGGGPAGLQLGYYMETNNQNYCILEQGQNPGTFFKKFPKHGTLISINKVHTGIDNPETNMRWDWNSLLTDDYSLLFKDYTTKYYADSSDLVQYFKDFANKYNLNIFNNHSILNISKDNNSGLFTVKTNQKSFKAKRVIVATGLSKPFIPNIKGIEHATQYYDLDINPEPLINKRVLIIGKGNSGFETANHLTDYASLIHVISPQPLKFAYNSRYPGHLRSINSIFMDTYLLKAQNGILNGEITEIKKACNPKNKKIQGLAVTINYNNAHNEVETIYYDEVICCTGFRFDASIFSKSCKPKLCIDDRFPALSTYYESENIPDLFFTGNITQSLDFKQKQSAFIHGFRYNAQFLAKYLLTRYDQASLITRSFESNVSNIVNEIITEINQNSAMWQQTGYMCCAYVFNKDKNIINFIPNVPAKYIQKTRYLHSKFNLIVTLDFGDMVKEPGFNALTHNRVHKENFEEAYKSTVIHPIIKLCYGDNTIATHHIIEDFENEWVEEVHIKPLEEFIQKCFNYIGDKTKSTGKSKA